MESTTAEAITDTEDMDNAIKLLFDHLGEIVHENAKAHGWHDKERSDAEVIALTHAELSEGLEYLRKDQNSPEAMSDHIPEFFGIEEEIADVFIRLLDWSTQKGYRVGEAILAKHQFNKSRPHRHGNKLF